MGRTGTRCNPLFALDCRFCNCSILFKSGTCRCDMPSDQGFLQWPTTPNGQNDRFAPTDSTALTHLDALGHAPSARRHHVRVVTLRRRAQSCRRHATVCAWIRYRELAAAYAWIRFAGVRCVHVVCITATAFSGRLQVVTRVVTRVVQAALLVRARRPSTIRRSNRTEWR